MLLFSWGVIRDYRNECAKHAIVDAIANDGDCNPTITCFFFCKENSLPQHDHDNNTSISISRYWSFCVSAQYYESVWAHNPTKVDSRAPVWVMTGTPNSGECMCSANQHQVISATHQAKNAEQQNNFRPTQTEPNSVKGKDEEVLSHYLNACWRHNLNKA